jgi:uncharacterized protein YhaN
MQGPVTIFDEDIYAGDAKLPDLKPNETRLVGYALDLGTEVIVNAKPQPVETISLRIAKGTLWLRRKYTDAREYVLKNKLARDKTVLIEQPFTPDWTLVDPNDAYERTQNLLRFKVPIKAEQTGTFPVKLERVGDEAVALTNMGIDDIRIYIRSQVISDKVKKALEKVVELRTTLDEITRRRERLEKEHQEANAEQGRIRENLKTLDKTTDAYQRQLKIFDQVDAKIAELAGQLTKARDEEAGQRKELESYLLNLEVE